MKKRGSIIDSRKFERSVQILRSLEHGLVLKHHRNVCDRLISPMIEQDQ